jgi:hypothetical protein
MIYSLRFVFLFASYSKVSISDFDFRRLRSTARNGTWYRRRCPLEGITKYANDGFASWAYLIVNLTYPHSRQQALIYHRVQILLLTDSRQGHLCLILIVIHLYRSPSSGLRPSVASWHFRGEVADTTILLDSGFISFGLFDLLLHCIYLAIGCGVL